METSEYELIGGEEKLLSPFGYFLSALFLFVIWIVGTAGNFLIFLLFFKNKVLRTPINTMLVNMAVFDFTMSFFGAPFPFFAAVLQKWPFGPTVCSAYAFIMGFGGIGSIGTLSVLSFERYLIISRPFGGRRFDMTQSARMIGGIWTYAAILTLPPLFGWGSYGLEGPKISCSINWDESGNSGKSYIIFLFVSGLLAPLLIIILTSFGIMRTLKQASRQGAQAVSRAEVEVLTMIGVIIGAFCLAWFPYAILSLLVAAGVHVNPSLGIIPPLIAKSSTCYNPIIYVGLNTQFRRAWRQLLGVYDSQRYADGGFETTVTASAEPIPLPSLNPSTQPTSSFLRDIDPPLTNETNEVDL